MTKDESNNDLIISYMKEHNESLSKKEQSSVSRCLSAKGGKPSKQDIAICISESRRKKSKMSEYDYNRPIPVTYQIFGLR